MKKKIVLMTMMTAAAAGVMLAGCNGGATPAAQTPEDTMALQAASAIQQAAVLAPSAGLRAAALPSVDFNFNLSMEGILPTLDLFLENGFQVNSEKVEGEFESNGVTYHYQETISYTDTSGKEKTYTLLYNMTGSKTETEEDETEVTTNFEGVATIDENTTWKFSSTINAETEGKDSESSVDFTLWTGENSYVAVTQEHEIEEGEAEMEFAYRVVSNGVTVNAFKIGIESEGESHKIEYEIGGLEFEMEKRVDKESGETLYCVSLETENGKEAKAAFRKVVDENGNVSYSLVFDYSNNNSSSK